MYLNGDNIGDRFAVVFRKEAFESITKVSENVLSSAYSPEQRNMFSKTLKEMLKTEKYWKSAFSLQKERRRKTFESKFPRFEKWISFGIQPRKTKYIFLICRKRQLINFQYFSVSTFTLKQSEALKRN